jgi:hypothetical protein
MQSNGFPLPGSLADLHVPVHPEGVHRLTMVVARGPAPFLELHTSSRVAPRCQTPSPRLAFPEGLVRLVLALPFPKEAKVSGELLVSRRRGGHDPRGPVPPAREASRVLDTGSRWLAGPSCLSHPRSPHTRCGDDSPFGGSCAFPHRGAGLRYERVRGRCCWLLPPKRSMPGPPPQGRLPLQPRWSSICLFYVVPSFGLPALSRCAGRQRAGPGGQPLKLGPVRASSVGLLRSLTSTRVCGETASEDATSRVFTRPRLRGGSSSAPTTAEAVWDLRADRGRAAFRPVRSISWTPLHFRGAGAVPSRWIPARLPSRASAVPAPEGHRSSIPVGADGTLGTLHAIMTADGGFRVGRLRRVASCSLWLPRSLESMLVPFGSTLAGVAPGPPARLAAWSPSSFRIQASLQTHPSRPSLGGCPCGPLVDPVVRIEISSCGRAARRPSGSGEPRPCWPHSRCERVDAVSWSPPQREGAGQASPVSNTEAFEGVDPSTSEDVGECPPGRLDCSRLEEPLSLAGVSSPHGHHQRSMIDSWLSGSSDSRDRRLVVPRLVAAGSRPLPLPKVGHVVNACHRAPDSGGGQSHPLGGLQSIHRHSVVGSGDPKSTGSIILAVLTHWVLSGHARLAIRRLLQERPLESELPWADRLRWAGELAPRSSPPLPPRTSRAVVEKVLGSMSSHRSRWCHSPFEGFPSAAA